MTWARRLAGGVVCASVFAACTSASTTAPPATTVGTRPPATTAPAVFTATISLEQEVSPAFRQGVARVPDGWIFSTNWALYRTDDAFVDGARNDHAIPPDWEAKGYNHIGDIDVVDDIVYAPVEQDNRELDRQAMFRFDATTLAFIDGIEITQHHNSFVTVDPVTMTAYSMDYFGGRALTRYDVRDNWRALEPLPMSATEQNVQGADVADGAIWLSTDDDREGLYRVDAITGVVQDIGSIGHVDGEGEGIDATALPTGLLHVLSIDVKAIPIRLIHLTVSHTP